MGLISKAKEFVAGEDAGDEEFEDEFVEGEGPEFVEEDWEDESVDDEEDEVMEWNSAYDFASEMLEEQGFASMNDFISKAMYRRVRKSPQYRDRIESGVETIDKLAETKRRLDEIQGGSGDKSWGEVADELEDADRAINAADSLSGKEDMYAQQALSIGQKLANSFMQGKSQSGGNTNVDTSVNRRSGEL